MEAPDNVLLAAFHVAKKRVRVLLHAGHVAWEPCRVSRKRHQVSLTDIVTATTHGVTFTLHYATRSAGHTWRLTRTTFVTPDDAVASLWAADINRQRRQVQQRPQRLIVFVNPFGGRRNAERIYDRRVRPLLELADIQVELVVTQRPNEIHETIMGRPLASYDAAATVGGDGTFAELFNGLVAREALELNIPMPPPDGATTLPRPRVPVAVIPGGSTNTVAFCLHGTDDATTCVLHLVLGMTGGLDLCSATCGDSVRLYASVLSYGYLGDIARESERLRWMGPRRYDYSGVRKFLRNRGYRGEVSVLLDPTDPEARAPKCEEECDRCQAPEGGNNSDTPWQVIRGKFLMVNGANMSCACRRSPAGMSPTCHLADGCVDVIVVHHTHILNNLRLLLKLSSRRGSVAELPFVRVLRAREFQFRAAEGATDATAGSTQPIASDSDRRSVWNCDGEVLLATDATVRTHRQLLTVFRRPLVAASATQGCALCNK